MRLCQNSMQFSHLSQHSLFKVLKGGFLQCHGIVRNLILTCMLNKRGATIKSLPVYIALSLDTCSSALSKVCHKA